MIVVIGSPLGRRGDRHIVADGFASLVALAAAGSAGTVQLVGRIGDDPAADAVLQDLARGGVGHVAILRDSAHATPLVDGGTAAGAAVASLGALAAEAADVELALRYLTDFSVLVLADADDESVLRVAIDAAAWGEADLIVVRPIGRASTMTDPTSRSLVLAPDEGEPERVFAVRVGRVAALLDTGQPRETALEAVGFKAAR